MEYLEVACFDGTALKIRIKDLIYSKKSDYQEVSIYDTYSFGKCLFLDGIIQFAEKDHEKFDKEIISKLKCTDKKILILGGGDGNTAEMALMSNSEISITIVERDIAVINACKKYLGQKTFDHSNVKIVIDDAVNFLNNNLTSKYDGVICDITDTPLGYSNIKEFYSEIYSLTNKVLTKNGWFTAYMGCNEDVVEEIIISNKGLNGNCKVSIESFGEPCFIIHGTNINKE